MPITERDKRRLDALFAIVKPANSLAARIDALPDDQRAHYEEWKLRCERWTARIKTQRNDDYELDERPYALAIQGYGPTLRNDISTALYGKNLSIPITATDDDAARIYRDHCDDNSTNVLR